jgi:alpha-glucosidase
MVLIKGLVIFFLCTTSLVQSEKDDWWKSATIYQIAPLSFKDTTGDGKGDIQGIISKLDYLADTGIDVLLISPFFQSGMVDFAYDISNYIEVDSIFGTMQDVEELFTKAKAKGLKVVLDFVPNHTSNKHEWFIKSEVGTDGYKDFYIWHDGAKQINEGRNLPPNSWQSEYGGSSWTWSPMREAYYYHKFAKEQPDLNLGEELVVQKLNEVLKFWLDKGADGFRLDAISQLFEDPAYLENPDKEKDLPQTYGLLERWRKFLDDYSTTESKILIPQVWNSPIKDLMSYYVSEDGTPRAQVPMNFMLINELNINSTASDYKRVIDKYISSLPTGAIANWFVCIIWSYIEHVIR